MYKIACIGIAVFGLVVGSDRLLHMITGFLAMEDFPLSFSIILREGQYLGLLIAGILSYQNKHLPKYFILFFVGSWFYFQFEMLTWPLIKPDFFGDTGWAAWKRAIDVVSVGLVHGGLLVWATYIIFKFNKANQTGAR